MKKIFIIPVMIMTLLLSSVVFCSAISTRAIGGATITTDITVSSGKANCKAYIIAERELVDKVSISIILQKKSGSSWSEVKSWSISENNYRANTSKSATVTKGSSYRTKAVYTMYKGRNLVERITDYSTEVSY